VQSKILKTVSYNAGCWEEEHARLITEQPVALLVNNVHWLTFMCTPVDLEGLGVGFLYNENIIQTLEDIASVRVCPGGENIDIWLNYPVNKPEKWIRTSGCSGGSTSVENSSFPSGLTNPQNGVMLPPEMIGTMINQLLESQDLYRKSGGVHTSALSDGERIILTAEDIGRHNTLDKLAGRSLLEQIKPSKRIILTTGRISSEMIQKAGRMRASMVISRTSPTSLSVRMAEKSGITLIGYARRERFIIYAHPERILTSILVREPCEA
jgi:FdhD protein